MWENLRLILTKTSIHLRCVWLKGQGLTPEWKNGEGGDLYGYFIAVIFRSWLFFLSRNTKFLPTLFGKNSGVCMISKLVTTFISKLPPDLIWAKNKKTFFSVPRPVSTTLSLSSHSSVIITVIKKALPPPHCNLLTLCFYATLSSPKETMITMPTKATKNKKKTLSPPKNNALPSIAHIHPPGLQLNHKPDRWPDFRRIPI